MTRAQKASTLATNFGTKSLKLFKLALVSTGVGALVVALGGLVSFLTSTQKGMDLVSKGTASVSTAFGVLKDRASDIGEGLSSIFSGDISGGFDLIKNSVKGVGDEIAEKVVAIVELKDQYQKLRDREIELIGTNAELRKGVEEARLLAKDENTTNAEKLKQLDLAIVKENELLDNQLEIASARAIIARGELDILKSTAEEIREVAELEAGVTELETANLKRRRTIASERLSLIRKIRKEQEQRELNDRKREIELIDDAEEQALAKELLRFDKALKGAIENKENLFLVNEVHEKRVRELTDRFAEERRKKLEDDAERERQIKEDANKKALSDAEALANFEAGLRTKGAEGIDDKENAGIEEAEQRSQFLLANDQLTADERALIELQLQDEISDIQKQAEEERLEQSKKATEEELAQQKELTDATLSLIETSTKQASDKKIKALDDELSASKEQQSKLQDLANKGSEDAVKSIALAQQREAELRREKEKEIQKQKLIEAGLTAFKVFSAKTEQGDKNALGNTITDLTTLQAFITGLSGFYEGTENVAESLGAPQLAGKDGHIIRVDGSERVIAGKDNKKMGGISNEKASSIIEMYNKGLLSEQLPNYDIKQQPYQSNEELLNEVKELQHVMKTLHKRMPQSSLGFDSFRGKFELKSKKGNNTTNYLFD
jgi:hypothetical protein